MNTETLVRKNELAVLDSSGDTKTIWDPNNEDEVEVAREMFKSLKKKGYLIYRAEGKEGRKGEQMKEFDAFAEKMIAVPAIVGG